MNSVSAEVARVSHPATVMFCCKVACMRNCTGQAGRYQAADILVSSSSVSVERCQMTLEMASNTADVGDTHENVKKMSNISANKNTHLTYRNGL